MATNPVPAAQPPQPYPRRFSWPMRIFLTVFVFSLTFRCFALVLPMYDWRTHYGIDELPPPLPPLLPPAKAAMREAINNEEVVETASVGSVLYYCKPWQDKNTRDRLKSNWDVFKFAAAWLNTRLRFVECLIGVSEQWGMYAPVVAEMKYHSRVRLCYSDGTDVVLWQSAEPRDYTRFGHWFQERVINHEGEVVNELTQRQGYCHMLAHRYAHNSAGAKLEKIVLLMVVVKLAPPKLPAGPVLVNTLHQVNIDLWPSGADALAHYEEVNALTATPPRMPGTFQSRPDSDEIYDFYTFEVEKGKRPG
ncbi:MAG TPA: hypothetical protein VE988_08835 [Gemmataceae bacterium]|nr:hypothetical protein [Gemmataceae bacterium]